jgi:hypothetical protein
MVAAPNVEISQGLSESLFALAFRVNVGGVEEVDAGFDGSLDELVGSCLISSALQSLTSAEGHGAKAEGRNEKSGVA